MVSTTNKMKETQTAWTDSVTGGVDDGTNSVLRLLARGPPTHPPLLLSIVVYFISLYVC